jgi:hypothetical protein
VQGQIPIPVPLPDRRRMLRDEAPQRLDRHPMMMVGEVRVQGQIPAPVPFSGRWRVLFDKVLHDLGRHPKRSPVEINVQGKLPIPVPFADRKWVLCDKVLHYLDGRKMVDVRGKIPAHFPFPDRSRVLIDKASQGPETVTPVRSVLEVGVQGNITWSSQDRMRQGGILPRRNLQQVPRRVALATVRVRWNVRRPAAGGPPSSPEIPSHFLNNMAR